MANRVEGMVTQTKAAVWQETQLPERTTANSGGKSAGDLEPVGGQHGRAGARSRRMVTMEHVGLEVDAAGPRDRPRHLVKSDLREDAGVPEWLETWSRQHRPKIKFPDQPVGEGQPEGLAPEVVTRKIRAGRLIATSVLTEALDQDEGFRNLCPFPVFDQLVASSCDHDPG